MLGRSVRTSQPQGPARIDWGNPITRGLVWAAMPHLYGMGNIITQSVPSGFSFAAGALRGVGRRGIALDNSASGGNIQFNYLFAKEAVDMKRVLSGAYTQIGIASYSNIGGNTSGVFNCFLDNTFQALSLVQNSTSSNIRATALTGLTAQPSGITTTDLLNSHSWAVATDAPAAGAAVDIDVGALSSSLTWTGTPTAFPASPVHFRIGYFQEPGTNPNPITTYWGKYYCHLIWDRKLSRAERKSVADNPWQIFAPDSKSLWTPAETISGAGSSITAASGSSTTSTATGQAQAASTQTATTGTSATSTITGSAVSSATITAANGTSTTGTLAPGGSSAATITPAGGTSTASTIVGSSTSGANVADGPPIGGFVAIGQLGPASPVASGSTIAPANGSSIAEILTSSTSAAATITSAAGTSVTSTMVGASTSGTAATMTAAGGTSITSTMTSSAISSAVMSVNSSSSITSTMVGFPPTENNADTHDGYFHKLWAKLAKKPEYQLEILEERLEEIAEEIQQVKAITRPVIYQSAPIPQNNPFDAQAKLLQALIVESARIRRDIEDEEEAEMLLML